MKPPATKFVFRDRRPGLLETFDYRSPYAFDSFAKWILNTLGRGPGGRGASADSHEIGPQFLGLSGRGLKRRRD